MPHVQITWVEGRTPEQKRKIAERITNVLIEDGRAKRENIHVAFHDGAATNYAEAGVLVADQKRTPGVSSRATPCLLQTWRARGWGAARARPVETPRNRRQPRGSSLGEPQRRCSCSRVFARHA